MLFSSAKEDYNNYYDDSRQGLKVDYFKNLLVDLGRFFYTIGYDVLNTFRRYHKYKNTTSAEGGVVGDTPRLAQFDAHDESPHKQDMYEWMQPIHGVYNAAVGLWKGLCSPLLLLDDLQYDCRNSSWSSLIPNVLTSLAIAGMRILVGAALILRGLSQVAATPLTWLIKKPLRNLWTWVHERRKQNQPIENSTSLNRQLDLAKKDLRSITISNTLHHNNAFDAELHHRNLHTRLIEVNQIFIDRWDKPRPTQIIPEILGTIREIHQQHYDRMVSGNANPVLARAQTVSSAKAFFRLFKPHDPAFALGHNDDQPGQEGVPNPALFLGPARHI